MTPKQLKTKIDQLLNELTEENHSSFVRGSRVILKVKFENFCVHMHEESLALSDVNNAFLGKWIDNYHKSNQEIKGMVEEMIKRA